MKPEFGGVQKDAGKKMIQLGKKLRFSYERLGYYSRTHIV